jgi:hypothetical protein
MRVFLAGIMQGSLSAAEVHDQDYRSRLRALLARHWPEMTPYDPWADHSDSLDYSPERAREVFLKHNRMCGECDLIIAYVPQASMGTAIEMWEAYRASVPVVTISPLTLNWAIKFTSRAVYTDWEAFEVDLASGRLSRLFEQWQRERADDRNDIN